MKQTINYTNNLSTFDNSKIPLEQQICLMKANEILRRLSKNKRGKTNLKIRVLKPVNIWKHYCIFLLVFTEKNQYLMLWDSLLLYSII